MSLSEAPLPGESTPSPSIIDRRASVRYLNAHDAFSYSLGKGSDVCLVAKVHDISQHGISLILTQRVEAGIILNVELQSKTQCLPCFLLARVVWTAELADSTLIVGCQFARPLTESELHALI